MSTYSLSQLTQHLQGKSVTLGWDALVFMNRAKVNTLLEQQYVERFSSEGFSPPVSATVEVSRDGLNVVELSGLMLSQPRLSFEKASLRNSRVTATMEIVAGTVSYLRRGDHQAPATVLSSYRIGGGERKYVTMDVDLAKSQGAVSDEGKVIVDIADGFNGRCDLVEDVYGQEALGAFFKGLFMAQPAEERVYVLGMLDLQDAYDLAPNTFMIRTMATVPGAQVLSDDYGEGAVVLFVNCKGNSQPGGDEPNEGALDYLIPNDRDDAGRAIYSGALVVASRVMFDWYIKFAVENQVRNGLKFKLKQESSDLARELLGDHGGFRFPDADLKWESLAGTTVFQHFIKNVDARVIDFAAQGASPALRVLSRDGCCVVDWQGRVAHRYDFEDVVTTLGIVTKREHTKFDVYALPKVNVEYVLRKTSGENEFEFISSPDSRSDCEFDYDEFEALPVRAPDHFRGDLTKNYKTSVSNAFSVLGNVRLPSINVLSISDILFPGQHVLQLSEARFPGDLLLVGQIDPRETTFTLEPLLPLVRSGDQQTFTLRQLGLNAAAVTWQVRGIDGKPALGSISQNGEYTAPNIAFLDGEALREVVTASYTDEQTGKAVSASAMVTVLLQGVEVTPSLSLANIAKPGPTPLKAHSLNGGPYRWTLLGQGNGTLQVNGDQAIYTPPEMIPAGEVRTVLIEVIDGAGEKTVATVLVRNGNFNLNIEPAVHPGIGPTGRVLLKAGVGQNRVEAPEYYDWSVVAGPGSVSASGVFTAPAKIDAPFSVVMAKEGRAVAGYSVIRLAEHARASKWNALEIFDFEVLEQSPRVYANGLQQAMVVVRIMAIDLDGDEVSLSPEEVASVRLVTADQHVPLPKAGKDGVPAGGAWYYSIAPNGYDTFPYRHALQEHRPQEVFTLSFFVQCHDVKNLKVAAELIGDNLERFYSNSSDVDPVSPNVIELIAVAPPRAGSIGGNVFRFSGEQGRTSPYKRVVGRSDYVNGIDRENDNDLNTLDYYYLELMVEGVRYDIKDVVFMANGNMVKWESDTKNEDVHSIVGYALPGSSVHHITRALLRNLNDDSPLPTQTIEPAYVPKGMLLLSLQRREYLLHDFYIKREFDRALSLIVLDRFGNRHALSIGFTDGRNQLRVIGS
ncbi:hypothetical protein [Pseudomonas fontis]|uniref:Uncharacterized protein n=1 Tax=Pseudomonas fontis TaxID=2942633 RepID=A0ABT5NTJ7_9PSED|nr:hypothetical protein [Pseudomonas fontis]MDD0974270.1 hypothetical protein [Pseudomonas fontis]MDD0991495.1 hypothetical protein [Pseudomonas fontis]